MTDWLAAILSLLAGMALGTVFFAGLYVTVHKAVRSRYPAVWFIISLLVRSIIVIVGLFWASGQQWQRLLIGTAGFILSRYLVIEVTKRGDRL